MTVANPEMDGRRRDSVSTDLQEAVGGLVDADLAVKRAITAVAQVHDRTPADQQLLDALKEQSSNVSQLRHDVAHSSVESVKNHESTASPTLDMATGNLSFDPDTVNAARTASQAFAHHTTKAPTTTAQPQASAATPVTTDRDYGQGR